jgi:hypothetical protein
LCQNPATFLFHYLIINYSAWFKRYSSRYFPDKKDKKAKRQKGKKAKRQKDKKTQTQPKPKPKISFRYLDIDIFHENYFSLPAS